MAIIQTTGSRFRGIRKLNSLAALVLIATTVSCSSTDQQIIDVDVEKKTDATSWEQFLAASTVGDPADEYYIVEGDIPIWSTSALREFYESRYLRITDKLAVHQYLGADEVWPAGDQRHLEYCVSTTFPASGTYSRTNVIDAMSVAASRWRQAADITFTYVPSRDSDCTSGTSIPHDRFFKVAPSSFSDAFACAFFPISRTTCAGLDGSTVGVDTNDPPPISLARTLTHELGHVLGLAHEYTRSDSPCPSSGSRNLTDYDVTSIMQSSIGACSASPTEGLSNLDGVGIRSLYSFPPSWVVVFDG